MSVLPPTMRAAIEAIAELPGLGPKSAQRLVLWLLAQPKAKTEQLGALLNALANKTSRCTNCGLFTDGTDRCAICRDPRRDASIICVVATATDVASIEATHEYRGLYHVLGGLLSPLEGVTAEQLGIDALLARIGTQTPAVREVIVAFDPTVEGESTALYIKNALEQFRAQGMTVSRLARGLPMNSALEYADQVTLGNALKERRAL